ncbi:uncharacterized protein [Pyrus communis]|uniref:uncharacterized protein n=1 Tax=Pyrus communis TaxID=23211 RepID=UPI0035C1EB2F
MKNLKFTLGIIFRDNVQFKRAVMMYSLVNGYGEIHFHRNEKLKITVKCAKDCPWMCVAGKMYGSNNIQIKTVIDDHTCGRTWANKNMTTSLLPDLYLNRIKLNPTWPVESFLSTVESEWNHGCTKMKAYKALNKDFKIIEGKHAEQYTKLWDFVEEVRRTNPGSTVKLKLDEGRFHMIYVCLEACKEGFKAGCRSLIGLDGCHLKVLHGGLLLCVVGIDPKDETWIIAYAVVEMENKATWIWFLQLLADDVSIENQNGWTFISDKQNGLILAFQKVLPRCHHRFCVRHLYTKYMNLFKGKTLKDALWGNYQKNNGSTFQKGDGGGLEAR